MKRISLCAMAFVLAPNIAHAYSYGCGVHYSPYALNYYSSGLVGGDVEYTPYALNYYSSGLVEGYGVCPDLYWDCGYPVFGFPLRHGLHGAFPVTSVIEHFGPGPARPAHPPGHPAHVVPPCSPRGPSPRHDGHGGPGPQMHRRACDDPMDVIRQHLRSRGCTAVSIDRILRVDDQLISVDVLVKDRNLLIKYWNSQEVERLSTKEAFKQKVYAQYKQDWDRFAEQYHAREEKSTW